MASNLSRGIAALLLMGGLSACQTTVDHPPTWNIPKPAEMTDEHRNSAIEARQVQESLPDGRFGFDPIRVDWDYMNGTHRMSPMSNMTQASLTSLTNGKYFIFADKGQDRWSVGYFAPDDTTSHFCQYRNGRYEEWTIDRYIRPANFGLAGILYWDPKKRPATPVPSKDVRGWPRVADSDKGLLYSYNWNGKKWGIERGWIQKEYAAAFAEKCPNLPRTSAVNNNQLGETLSDLIPEATAIRGFRTAFKNDPEDPLTASMYYWLYPPE